MSRRHFLQSSCALAASAVVVLPGMGSAADAYPNRPIRIIVAYAPGTVLDMWARRVADRLSRALRQQVIVENRPGASGTLGAVTAANAAPDGYTLLFGGASEIGLSPSLFPNLPYIHEKPFQPITRFTSGNAILVVNPALDIRNIDDLIAQAKAKPGSITGGSPGTGTLTHLLLLALNRSADIDILHVPYKSGTQALTDVMAGHIDVMFDWATACRTFIESGKLRPLLIAGSTRKPFLPQVPAATEMGWEALNFRGWNVFLAPHKTPRSIIDTLHKAMLPILRSADFEAEIALAASEIVTTTPEETAVFIAAEQNRARQLVQLTGVKLDQ